MDGDAQSGWGLGVIKEKEVVQIMLVSLSSKGLNLALEGEGEWGIR